MTRSWCSFSCSNKQSEVEAIPTEDLAALFAQLQQRPKWSQMVELLSMLGSGKENFTFDEVKATAPPCLTDACFCIFGAF
jgi:hypothetical protein